jgi:hypothetical protein
MKNNKKLLTRKEQNEQDLNYRQMSVRLSSDGSPGTLDVENRSVEVVVATEEPVMVFDYERYEIIPEILLMSGVEMPKSRQVPMLDTHSRWDTTSVLGSVRSLKANKGEGQLIGRSYFSTAPESEGPWTKVREGHLTDFSVGYKAIRSEWVPEGETAKIKGNSYDGPVMVRTRWRVKEVSLVPIGADELAKVRSEPTKQNSREDDNMDPQIREFLISRGLAETATEDEAWDFLRTLDVPVSVSGENQPGNEKDVDIEKIRAAATEEERDRFDEIEAMCRDCDCEDMLADFIRKGVTVDAARKEILKVLRTRLDQGAANLQHHGPAEITADQVDKFRAAATDSILGRAGMPAEDPAPGHDELMGYTLRELARQPMEMIGRALITSDLPYILANVANKALFAGYETAPETWRVWCGVGSVPDFKTNYIPRVSEISDLDEVPEHGEYKYGKVTEAQESFAVPTYGKLFAITRQTIINDDLGALTNIPAGQGESAARKVGDVAYAVLTANAAMGDGVALFHATHANFVAGGSGAIPGQATIAAGILAMGVQKDLQGLRRLNIRPEFFIAPKALEGAAEVFFQTIQFSDHSTVATDSSFASTRTNLYAGSYFTRVYDGRLDDNDAAAWFLAGPKGKTVTVFFLNGVETPYLETKAGWSVDGIEYKVRIDVGAKAVDWKALYMNDGN